MAQFHNASSTFGNLASLGVGEGDGQALAIGTHNLATNDRKNNLFSQNGSKNNAYRVQDVYDMWDLIVSVPDHYLSFYFSLCMCKIRWPNHMNWDSKI